MPYCASRTSDPEAGNAIMEFLILHIQEIVRTKELEPGTSWDEKKRLMQVENKILTSSLLDRYQTSIEKAFEDCILEEFQRTKQELQRMRRFEEQKGSRPISPPRSRSSS